MTTVKTALLLVALSGLLLMGATAAAQPPAGGLACSPALEPVCFTYYHYCRNYLNFCPIA